MKTEEIATATDSKLINWYVWGEENGFIFEEAEIELDKRGINTDKLVAGIEDLIYDAEMRTL